MLAPTAGTTELASTSIGCPNLACGSSLLGFCSCWPMMGNQILNRLLQSERGGGLVIIVREAEEQVDVAGAAALKALLGLRLSWKFYILQKKIQERVKPCWT